MATAQAVYNMAAPRYVQFVGTEISTATEGPIDRAVLVAFVELINGRTVGRVADVGCGPGRVAAFMTEHGLDVIGLDVSQAMLAVARTAHPQIKLEEGRLDALPIATGALAGAVCWYSIIHTPLAELPVVFDEFRRAMAPGGYLLVGIHVGTGTLRVTQSYGHDVSVELQLLRPEEVTVLLESCGFSIVATLSRAPEGRERRPQAFVLARRTGERRPA